MISAEIICDSISNEGRRLTTMRLRYPKFIHGEFMTHRMFSRNASSSRAIPTKRYLEEVRSDELRACPVFWGKNQAGMQAAEELTGINLAIVQEQWRRSAFNAAAIAESMAERGAHKQIVNRILEPYLHINVVVTATEYMNFFGLRLDEGAQPEIRVLAEEMWQALQNSTPKLLQVGEWHLPYVNEKTWQEIGASGDFLSTAIKVSVARCARVSYTSFETGKTSTVEEDLKLHDRLVGNHPIHASPAEHQACPDKYCPLEDYINDPPPETWANPHEHGNFIGWRQYRKMLIGEAIAPLPENYRRK